MPRMRSLSGLILVVAVLSAWGGCAKRPVGLQTAVSAPAPAVVSPAPPPAVPASPEGNAARAAKPPSAAAPAAPPPGPAGSAGVRPSPRDFTAADALKDVYFDFDRHTIRPDAATALIA